MNYPKIFRDKKLVEETNQILNLNLRFEDDAIRYILAESEQKLRLIIQKAHRYVVHTGRRSITNDDINAALSDLGLLSVNLQKT